MELNNRYWKSVKNYFIMPIVFSVVGFVYAAIFWSCAKGIFVGFLVGIMYLVLTFFFGHCFNQEYVTDKLRKTITILMNAVAFVGMCYGITMVIGNNKPITLHYEWIHIVNCLFVGIVVGKANYDGKVLRNFIKENVKREHLTESTDEVV